jgi:hypothetical protein
MLSTKKLVATMMVTGMLAPAFISAPGVFAEVTTSNEPLTEVTQSEKTLIPYVTLNGDRLGETITSLSVENNILTATRTTNSPVGYVPFYNVYSSDSPEFNLQTATLVESLFINPDNGAQVIGTESIGSYPLARYYYVVDGSADGHNIPLIRINGVDLSGNC